MPEYTSRKGLIKPLPTEKVNVEDLNRNFDMIDAIGQVNLLDNSDFLHPVNQRGKLSDSISWAYFIDRWILASVTSGEKVYYGINQTGAGIGFSTPSGGNLYLIQRIPKGVISTGKKYTVGYETSSGVKVVATASFSTANEAYDAVNISIPSGTYIRWIALYEGEYTTETLPTYIPKGYSAELGECLRYFYRMTVSGTSGEINNIIGFGHWASQTSLRISVILPQVMRLTPTVSMSGEGLTSVVSGTGTASKITALTSLWKVIGNNFTLVATSTGGTSSAVGWLRLNVNGVLSFSADL